jgi:ADP-ribosylglycohydrolase
MLLELAIGDAYGAGFEYVAADIVAAENTVARYRKHQKHDIAAGRYTDDTQMSLAIAEAVVSGDEWTPEMLADRFVAAFRRDPRTGYASHFQTFLERVESGAQFLAEIRPASDRSGAAMRVAPVGVFPTVAEVVEKATVQARLTHDTPDGIAAARAAALMSHYFLYDRGPKAELGAWLEERVPGFPWAEPWDRKVGSKGWMSVRAAVSAVMANDSLTGLLRACVAFTGDVDTVATVALAAASGSREYARDLPAPLIWGLESGRYGRDYLLSLDEKLMVLVQKEKPA